MAKKPERPFAVEPLPGETRVDAVSEPVVEAPVVKPPEPVSAVEKKPEPEPEPVQDSGDMTVADHLKIIHEYRSINVPTFRSVAGCGREAVAVLAGYVADGLVNRDWREGYGYYSLTKAGQEFIK
jgi:hypothetical protein